MLPSASVNRLTVSPMPIAMALAGEIMDGWDRDGVPKDDSIPPSGRRRWSSTLSLRGSTLLRSMERRLLLPLDSDVGPIVDVES